MAKIKKFGILLFVMMGIVLIFVFYRLSLAPRGAHIAGGESGSDFMVLFDLNKDGKISHEEWEEVKPSTVYREKSWPFYDRNFSGSITIDEVPLKAGESEPPPPEVKKFKITTKQIVFIGKYDKNQDMKVSKTEYVKPDFSSYDQNENGFIEPHEAPKN
jgi:hypothetical protein